MADVLEQVHGVSVLMCGPDGQVLRGDGDALDLIAEAFGVHAEWVMLPVERLDPEFFRLSSGVAGGIVQKFAGYRMGLIVLGDVTGYADSGPFRDFVRETNRGRQLWFLPDVAEVERRLALVGQTSA